MDSLKTARVSDETGDAGDTKIGSAKKKRTYSRGQLFEIAKSIAEISQISEDLDKFRRSDLTRHHLDVMDWNERGAEQQQQQSARGPSFRLGRTNSGLESELSPGRLNADNTNSQQQQHMKIYRMTSKPTIRSNWPPDGQAKQMDELSSQVRAKYARLIKTMSGLANSSANGQMPRSSQIGGGPNYGAQSAQPLASMPSSFASLNNRQSLVRTTNHNSRLTGEPNGSRQPLAGTASHSFGPPRPQGRGERRNSEEPMSLPYSINTNGRATARDLNASSGAKLWAKSADKCKSIDNQCPVVASADSDDRDTPIMRIVAPQKSPNECAEDETSGGGQTARAATFHADADEDDFDITSLLSITVLSDIKTIRQDLASFSRQSSNLTKSSLGRTKSHDPTSRMPARSRTALELHYNNNSNNSSSSIQEQRRRQNNFDTYEQHRKQNLHQYQTRAATLGRPQFQSRQFNNYSDTTNDEFHYNQSESLPFDWQSSSDSQLHSSAGVGLFASPEVAPRSQYLANISNNNNSSSSSIGARQEPLVAGPEKSATGAGKAATAGTEKPVDKSVAKIIESFKTQVKARATAPIVRGKTDEAEEEEEEEKSRPVAEASKSRSGGSGSSTSGAKATGSVAEINSVAPNEIRSGDAGASSRVEPVAESGQNGCDAPSERLARPTTGTNPAECESESGTTKTPMVTKATTMQAPTSTATPPTAKLDNEQQQQQQGAGGKSSGPARVSNIPRLISLHRAKSNQDASSSSGSGITNQAERRSVQRQQALAPDDGPTTDGGPGGSGDDARATKADSGAASVGGGRANLKQSCKFVSQYKALRGKSLADEVEESSSRSSAAS